MPLQLVRSMSYSRSRLRRGFHIVCTSEPWVLLLCQCVNGFDYPNAVDVFRPADIASLCVDDVFDGEPLLAVSATGCAPELLANGVPNHYVAEWLVAVGSGVEPNWYVRVWQL